ncbi:potassium channel family protein [Kineococcus radiotolerans]|uniref:TrkA-N domain protein n=1 Tax=Kineococcus radiotolerans (strain ATCC BAA-149 / DSM 14245 / SRS30216) TaxID=266940 RepID=A6WE27_KINRD|nr:potassium channel family protein [Kineococcus radiotolerans]ABS05066.1 TrkA-N domain protein [Kineococcus radiotolerans SRS30216 = ATCC BAA-149]
MPRPDVRLRLPRRRPLSPLVAIAARLGVALALVLAAWGMVLLERDGYTDNLDGAVSVTDALYYTTVTLSTTGYGDIVPTSDAARLVNALVVTPMRVLFVIVLVGTTIQALTERSRTEIRLARWRSRMRDHVIVLGYGTKGRNAVRALRLQGQPVDRIVVVDRNPAMTADAAEDGYVCVTGDVTRSATFTAALVERAARVVVAVDRDDTSILATLALRRINPTITVVASAREAEHADLLRQSGASSVVVSSETTGRLLGLAAHSPAAVEVVEDLVSFGAGLDLADRPVTAQEVGRGAEDLDVPVLAVVREGRTLRYRDPELGVLRRGDRLLYVAAG